MTQPANPTSPQLSEENLAQLAIARKNHRKISRAVSVARFDGWTLGIFGGLTLLAGITDISCLLIGLVLCACAFIELRGAAKLSRLDPTAIPMLTYNQLALATLLFIYAVWNLIGAYNGVGIAALADQDPQVAQQLGSVEGITRSITVILYAGLIAVAIFGQGGMAYYYFTRRRPLQNYLEQTPPWIRSMQSAGMTL